MEERSKLIEIMEIIATEFQCKKVFKIQKLPLFPAPYYARLIEPRQVPVWPDVGIKSNQNFPIGRCPKGNPNSFFLKKWDTSKLPKHLPKFWADFKVTREITLQHSSSSNGWSLSSFFARSSCCLRSSRCTTASSRNRRAHPDNGKVKRALREGSHIQSDQIGLFLEYLGDKLTLKSRPNTVSRDLLGSFENKDSNKTALFTFGKTFRRILATFDYIKWSHCLSSLYWLLVA